MTDWLVITRHVHIIVVTFWGGGGLGRHGRTIDDIQLKFITISFRMAMEETDATGGRGVQFRRRELWRSECDHF